MSPVFISVPPMVRDIIGRTIQREGGFVDHPSDPGGATNLGITFATLQAWRGEPITKDDVRDLTETEAIQIYYQNYWEKLSLSLLGNNWWVKEFIFDWCVNGGLRNPVRQIQRLVRVKSDGYAGPMTYRALLNWMKTHEPESQSRLVDCRITWYLRIVKKRPASAAFLEGWFNRANDFRYETRPFRGRNLI